MNNTKISNNSYFYNDFFNHFENYFKSPTTDTMQGLINLHDDIMFFLFIIVIIVFWILIDAIIKFRTWHFNWNDDPILLQYLDNYYVKRPVPKHWESLQLEIGWTVLPTILLGTTVLPSFSLLYSMDKTFDFKDYDNSYSIKIMGNQWYWTYEHSFTDHYFKSVLKYLGLKNNNSVDLYEEFFKIRDIFSIKNNYFFGKNISVEEIYSENNLPKDIDYGIEYMFINFIGSFIFMLKNLFNIDNILSISIYNIYSNIIFWMFYQKNKINSLDLDNISITNNDIKNTILPNIYIKNFFHESYEDSLNIHNNNIFYFYAMLLRLRNPENNFLLLRDNILNSDQVKFAENFYKYNEYFIKDILTFNFKYEMDSEYWYVIIHTNFFINFIEKYNLIQLSNLKKINIYNEILSIKIEDVKSILKKKLIESRILPVEELNDMIQWRFFKTDNPLLIPIKSKVKIILSSLDVIHSWGVSDFGFKLDCIPGRMNLQFLNIKEYGRFFGNCFELCGLMHGFMPVEILAVSPEMYFFYTSVYI